MQETPIRNQNNDYCSSVPKDIVISATERIQKDSTERDLNEPLARILKKFI